MKMFHVSSINHLKWLKLKCLSKGLYCHIPPFNVILGHEKVSFKTRMEDPVRHANGLRRPCIATTLNDLERSFQHLERSFQLLDTLHCQFLSL